MTTEPPPEPVKCSLVTCMNHALWQVGVDCYPVPAEPNQHPMHLLWPYLFCQEHRESIDVDTLVTPDSALQFATLMLQSTGRIMDLDHIEVRFRARSRWRFPNLQGAPE